jgi:hypothetical protein
LQAGEGTWLWPVSDDDHINFALPATLRATLEKCPCRLCLLQDADPGGPRPPELLKGADFLERYVASTVDLLQIGRVICRRDLVVAVDAESWQRQEHNLHSHLAPYARGILDDGILLLQCSPFERPLERTFPRWDLLDGQLGAWRASLIAFPDHHAIVNRREQVIREPCVFHAFGYRIIVGKAIAAQDWTFAFRVVSGRTRLKLLVLLVLSGVQPETRRRWLPRLFPRNRVLPQYIERHKTDQQARHRGAPDPSLIPPATAGTSHSGSIHG